MNIEKLLKYKEDDKLAIYEEIVKFNDAVESFQGIKNFDFSTLSHLKGEDGKSGKDPVRGVDYFNSEDIQDFVDIVSERLYELIEMHRIKKGIDYFDGKDGAPGKDGIDGKTPDMNDIMQLIEMSVQSGVESKMSKVTRSSFKGMDAKGIMEEYRKLPRNQKVSWSEMFKEEGNPFSYYQVGGSGTSDLVVNRMAFKQVFNNGSSGTTKTIDWSAGNKQSVTLSANTTLSFTNIPTGVSNFTFHVKQDATGSRLVTWPSSVRWSNDVAPTLTTTALRSDFITFVYDGTLYYGAVSPNYATV